MNQRFAIRQLSLPGNENARVKLHHMYQLHNLFPGFSPLSETKELFGGTRGCETVTVPSEKTAWCSCRVLMPALYLIFSELSWDT